jgi:hypothetical protein
MIHRGFHGVRVLAGFMIVAVLLAVLAAGGVAWRLARGPLDVTSVARVLAAAVRPRLTFASVTLQLDARDLRVAVTGLRVGAEDGPSVDNAAATLAVEPLLHGLIRPRDFIADGVRLQATRNADGVLSVVGVPVATTAPAAVAPRPPRSFDPALIAAFTHVAIHGATLAVADSGSQQTGEIRNLMVDLQRDAAGGLVGHAQATLSAGNVTSDISLDATREPGDAPADDAPLGQAASRVHVTVAAVNPAALAPLAPALAPLAALDATIALTADLALAPDLGLRRAVVHAEAGPGRVFLPAKGGGTSPGNFASVALDAAGDMHALKLTALRVVLTPPSGSPPSTVVISGDASRSSDHAVARVHVALDRARMSDLGTIWPVGVGGGARPWLADNVVAGAVHDGTFDLVLETGAKFDDVALTGASGTMQAEGVTLYWLRPVPPLNFAHVVLTLVDPDSLTLTANSARQGALVGRQIFMRIWGMSTKDQFSQIDGDITAPIADVFTLLKHPRLELLSAHPLPISNPTGQSVTHLTVKLPLDDKVTMDAVGIHATTHLTAVRIPSLALGRPLDQGVFDADISQDGLSLTGTARVAGLASTLTVAMDFRDGPPDQVVQHVTVAAHGDDRALSAAGLNTMALLAGAIAGTLDYAEQRNGHAVVQGSADLSAASLSTPLGWSKPAGPAASLSARAELDHGHLIGFDELRADGPGLSIQGSGELVDGAPSILHINRCVIGRTSLSGTLTFPLQPGDALRVALSGPQLDLSGPLKRQTTLEPSTPDSVPPGRPYKIDLRFDRVMMRETGAGIGPVSLSASGDERRIAQAHFMSAGPEQADIRIEPRGDVRRLTATVGDFGMLLRRLGAGLEIDDGAFELNGEFDDRRAGSPLTGTATLTRFGVRGASILGKILQGMTLYGLVDALDGPGLRFDQLTMPFAVTGSVVKLLEARAFSSSLGVTTQGQVDFGHGTVDLTGTIVPAYFFNTLPGKVPLIGRLFSPETGGGLFAATFALSGPAGDPAVSVNPLATLAPGALRSLFGLF